MNRYEIFIFISVFIYSTSVFRNAKEMGYSGFFWFVVSFLYRPLVAIYFLAILPNRNLEKERKEEIVLLKKQLLKSHSIKKANLSAISEQTISDNKTIN